MKIVIVGATGQTGKELITQALAAGHTIIAYVRRPEAMEQRPGLNVVPGQLDDVVAMQTAMQGADAVISCLGPKPGLRSMLRTDQMRRALPSITAAMKGAGVARLVLLSALGVGDTADKASAFARFLYRTAMAAIFGDKARAEAALPGSGLNWTSVHPVILTNGPRTGTAKSAPLAEVGKIPGLPKVSRADVAAVLLEVANSGTRGGEKVLVWT